MNQTPNHIYSQDMHANNNRKSVTLAMLSAIPSMIYVFNTIENRYDYVSTAIADLLGYDVHELVTASAEDTQLKVHPQDYQFVKNQWLALLKDKKEEAIKVEYRYKNARGQWTWLRDTIKVFGKTEKGRIAQVIGTVADITVEKDAEKDIQRLSRRYADYNQRLKEQNDTLAAQEKNLTSVNEELLSQQEVLKMAFDSLLTQKNELDKTNEILTAQKDEMSKIVKELSDRNFELDQFVYKISHDIRSPLTSILGLVNLMKIETEHQRLMSSVAHIEKSVLKLDTFVRSMLDFARVSREDTIPEEILFFILLDDCMANFKYLENFDKLAIDIDIKENGNKFYADALRISSIFQNIISNAIKYRNPTLFNSFLNIKIDVTPTVANIVFEDNGIGIKEEYLDKVFGMFVRATERSDGSGLGLYIVKQSVERIGGTIEIRSKYGIGTKITMQLPNLYSLLPTY